MRQTPPGPHTGETPKEVREIFYKIYNLPEKYPDMDDAFDALANDPFFKQRLIKPITSIGNIPNPNGPLIQSNRIGMGYFLRSIGENNLNILMNQVPSKRKQDVLKAILVGDLRSFVDLLLSFALNEHEPMMSDPLSIKEQIAKIVENIFSPNSELKQQMMRAKSIVLGATEESEKEYIRRFFNDLAQEIRKQYNY